MINRINKIILIKIMFQNLDCGIEKQLHVYHGDI